LISAIGEKSQPCQKCGKCCETHPCALAPEDFPRIANFLGLTQEELFKKFLVLDYVEDFDKRSCYVTPARKNELPGRIVEADWTFAKNPCIFLLNGKCSIEQVKPKGGRDLFCSLMNHFNRNLIGYGKKEAAQDWSRVNTLKHLIALVAKTRRSLETDQVTLQDVEAHVSTLGSSFTTLPTT
jgi:Fe-S-cluster containining protein